MCLKLELGPNGNSKLCENGASKVLRKASPSSFSSENGSSCTERARNLGDSEKLPFIYLAMKKSRCEKYSHVVFETWLLNFEAVPSLTKYQLDVVMLVMNEAFSLVLMFFFA